MSSFLFVWSVFSLSCMCLSASAAVMAAPFWVSRCLGYRSRALAPETPLLRFHVQASAQRGRAVHRPRAPNRLLHGSVLLRRGGAATFSIFVSFAGHECLCSRLLSGSRAARGLRGVPRKSRGVFAREAAAVLRIEVWPAGCLQRVRFCSLLRLLLGGRVVAKWRRA